MRRTARGRRDTEIYRLAREGEFGEGPVVDERIPDRKQDDPEPWWDRWLEEVA